MPSPEPRQQATHGATRRFARRALVWSVVVAMAAVSLGLLLMPAIGSAEGTTDRIACRANLESLWEELERHLLEQGTLPVDFEGRFSLDGSALAGSLRNCPGCRRPYLANPHVTAADVQAKTAHIPLALDPIRAHIQRSFPLPSLWEQSFQIQILYADGHIQTRSFDSTIAYRQFLAGWSIPLE